MKSKRKTTPPTTTKVVATPDGGPAFPLMGVFEKEANGRQKGMSLRDWFAGMAMAALLGNANVTMDDGELSGSAYIHADAMLRARKAEVQP